MSRLTCVRALCAASLLSLSLWGSQAGAKTTSPEPGEGTLLVATERLEAPVPMPLVSTAVTARIIGFVGQVKVQQTFNNPFTDPLEAVYVFPLPDNAAVSDMTIKVGPRIIRGLIKKRGEARKIYKQAKSEGKTAALLDQERPNIFTQSVANIEPNKQVVVEITYDVALRYDDGKYLFDYPMTVGPRYIPGAKTAGPQKGGGTAADTDQVPDASRISPPVAAPGSRSGRNVTIDVILEPGMAVQELYSPTHAISAVADPSVSPHAMRVALAQRDEIPNKDFVLRYRVADDKPAVTVQSHKDPRGGYFALRFEPPARANKAVITAKEVFFVVDTSGSMRGPLQLVKQAMLFAIRNLGPNDTFQIIRFSNGSKKLSPSPLPNTPANVAKANSFIAELDAGGGTEMIAGVRAALDESRSKDKLRVVSFMTDGYIGNDTEILAAVDKLLGDNTRLFSFGVGSSPNRYLLERMAEVGRGTVQYILPNEKPEQAVESFYRKMRAPVLTHIAIDWAGLKVEQVSPEKVRDLFVGQPLSVLGRYDTAGAATVKIRGKVGGRPVVYNVPVTLSDADSGSDVLARLWARDRIHHLEAAQFRRARDPKIVSEITQLGLDYRLVTKYTSFVAVDEKMVQEGGVTRTVQVPVHKPSGMRIRGALGDDDDDDDSEPMDAPLGGALAREFRLDSSGRWRFGAGAGLGLRSGTADGQSALVSSLHLRADRRIIPDLAVGGQLGLLIPAGEDSAVTLNLLAELAYMRLFEGALEVVFGTGPSISSDGFGAAVMAALEYKTPAFFGVQLRYDLTVRPAEDEATQSAVTLGVEFTF